MEFKNVLSPIKIGTMEVKNRFMVAAMGTGHGSLSGFVDEQWYAYYEKRAEGGFGLITIESSSVNKNGLNSNTQPGIWSDEFKEQWVRVAKILHQYGTKVSVQINDSGRQNNPLLTDGTPVSGPSPIACPVFDVVPHELTTEEIQESIERYVSAAKRAKDWGLDAVELHCGHGFLIAQFLSPMSNKRYDEYGGDLEGRCRFVCDIIRGIKERCGKDFPVIAKITGDEKMPGGLTIADTKIFAKYMEEAGLDAIGVTVCAFPSLNWMSAPADIESGFNAENAKLVKESVSIPVITVNRVNTPEIAEDIIATGKADMVDLGRGSLADPEFPKKVAEGRIDEISKCIGCLQACLGNMLQVPPLPTSCLVNPITGHESEWKYEKAEVNKKIFVVGGGPAGLECAWLLSKRGYDVTIYEKSKYLGGQYRVGAYPPCKQSILTAIKFWITMNKKYGTKIVMNTEVTPEMIQEEKPDVVVLATGGIPLLPKIEGIENENLLKAIDVIAGDKVAGRNNLILGGGLVGAECADFLREHNRSSVIVDQLPDIALDLYLGAREHLMNRLSDVKRICNAKITKIYEDGIDYEKDGSVETLRGFDNVILALGAASYNPLEEKIEDFVKEVYVIGDAKKAGRTNNATSEAAELANRI
ncbi:MAG: FAD-dependent oxidoreductase [Solobacterium sp.]|nr:FAD-dependent oxidoreductase [Solobacterium sp.]